MPLILWLRTKACNICDTQSMFVSWLRTYLCVLVHPDVGEGKKEGSCGVCGTPYGYSNTDGELFKRSTVSRLDMSVSQFIDEYSKVCVSDQCTLSIILIRRVSLICLTVTAHCVWTMWVLWQLRIVTMTEVETRKIPDTSFRKLER